MSDSFADLWNATAPSKPAQSQPPRTLGSVTPAVAGQQRKPANDVFSMLAAPSSSTSRSVSPSYSSQPLQKSSSLGGTPVNGGPKPVQKATSSGGDAFSDLLGGTIASRSSNTNLTIAERAALVEKQRIDQHAARQATASTQASAWAGLDALGNSSSFRANSVSPQPPVSQPEDDWGFDFGDTAKPAAATPAPVKATAPAEDDWGLDDFIAKPAPKKASETQKASQSQSIWDIDEFASPPAASSLRGSPAPQNDRSSTPGSFDFGEREDGLLDDRSDGEDDILGDLARPVSSKPTRQVRAWCMYVHARSNIAMNSSLRLPLQEQLHSPRRLSLAPARSRLPRI